MVASAPRRRAHPRYRRSLRLGRHFERARVALASARVVLTGGRCREAWRSWKPSPGESAHGPVPRGNGACRGLWIILSLSLNACRPRSRTRNRRRPATCRTSRVAEACALGSRRTASGRPGSDRPTGRSRRGPSRRSSCLSPLPTATTDRGHGEEHRVDQVRHCPGSSRSGGTR